MFVPYGDLPPEIRQEIEREVDKADMVAETFRHDIQRMFDEMEKEHLVTLRLILRQLANSDDVRLSCYLEGVAATTLHHRFHVCSSCGKDHDEELLKGMNEKSPAQVPEMEPDPVQNYKDNLALYQVHTINTETTQVVCDHCDYTFASLEDRMRREAGPSGCPGCIHKAKWG